MKFLLKFCGVLNWASFYSLIWLLTFGLVSPIQAAGGLFFFLFAGACIAAWLERARIHWNE